MLDTIFAPYHDMGLLILRIGVGLVMLAHGWPKLNPGSSMGGIVGVGGFFRQLGIPVPTAAAWLVTFLETFGAVLLIVGLGTRILALGFAIDMLVAIARARIGMMKAKFAGGSGIGWEFEFIQGMGSLALLFLGAGQYAVDAALGL